MQTRPAKVKITNFLSFNTPIIKEKIEDVCHKKLQIDNLAPKLPNLFINETKI